MKTLKKMSCRSAFLAGLVLGAMLPALHAAAQSSSTNMQTGQPYQPRQTQGPIPMGPPVPGNEDPTTTHMEQERQRLLVDDRQRHLLEDSARLVQLSNELKAEVDKSGKFVTSVTAIRDAEEIEKLAHSLRDRLKN
jgi:hypothetical protein